LTASRALRAEAEVERLQDTVAKLPKTADGMYATAGKLIFSPQGTMSIVPGIVGNGPVEFSSGEIWPIDNCYSTREAAEAAGGEG
jgi:hypothetical protein